MYDSLFCRMYNEFGWNEYPRAFGERLLVWLQEKGVAVHSVLDLGCGTGVLCETLHEQGIVTLGIDLSEEMIAIARKRAPELHYEVGDMTAFHTDGRFDLVTCTGDALNHVTDLKDVGKVFACVREVLNPGGLFVFDLLRADEVPEGEPFWADFGDLRVRFSADRDGEGYTTLRIDAFEGEVTKFSEIIREKTHDVGAICDLLRDSGFDVLQCADRLDMDHGAHGTTWFIVARRRETH